MALVMKLMTPLKTHNGIPSSDAVCVCACVYVWQIEFKDH